MSRREKERSSLPLPFTGPPSPATIIEVYGNSGWVPGEPLPSPEFIEEVTRRKRLQFFADDLIQRLTSDKPRRVQAARAALMKLSGVDLGPEPGATEADRERARAAWRAWWDGQK